MPFTSESAEELREIARQFVSKECNEWKTLVWDEQCHYPKELFDQFEALMHRCRDLQDRAHLAAATS